MHEQVSHSIRISRPLLAFSGAAGVVLAILLYLLATRVGGLVSRLIPPIHEEQVVVSLLITGIALMEVPATVFALRTLSRSKASRWLLYGANVLYVAFAGVYAAMLVLLFGETFFSALLVSLSAVRLVSDWWVR